MQIAKALIAKAWKKETTNLAPGTHYIDETLTVKLAGRSRNSMTNWPLRPFRFH